MNDVTVEPLSEFADLKIITPLVFTDRRGTFSEAYSQPAIDRAGLTFHPVQDNHSFSWKAGTIRGLHFQTPPLAQAKLVRVIRGAIYDVAVDIRHGSPTFGRFAAVELSAQNRKQFLIPSGFAHGYCTLTAETEVLYKVDAPYAPANDTGLLWNDPDLGIPWPVQDEDAVLSDKDAKLSRLKDLAPYFYSAGHSAR